MNGLKSQCPPPPHQLVRVVTVMVTETKKPVSWLLCRQNDCATKPCLVLSLALLLLPNSAEEYYETSAAISRNSASSHQVCLYVLSSSQNREPFIAAGPFHRLLIVKSLRGFGLPPRCK